MEEQEKREEEEEEEGEEEESGEEGGETRGGGGGGGKGKGEGEKGEGGKGDRSQAMWQERFNLASADRNLLVGDAPAGPAHQVVGSAFAGAWRNYIESAFKKELFYKISRRPSAHFYVADNKTLAGKEDRLYEGEALGRKLAAVFF